MSIILSASFFDRLSLVGQYSLKEKFEFLGVFRLNHVHAIGSQADDFVMAIPVRIFGCELKLFRPYEA